MQLNVTSSGDQVVNVNTQNAFVLATVSISEALNIVSDVLGWIYFVAWSVSFYPQIYQGGMLTYDVRTCRRGEWLSRSVFIRNRIS